MFVVWSWCICLWLPRRAALVCVFFFNDTATTEIYTLSLHDALPICPELKQVPQLLLLIFCKRELNSADRKSTRLNSSHQIISYAVFCLKKQKEQSVEPFYENLITTINCLSKHRSGA